MKQYLNVDHLSRYSVPPCEMGYEDDARNGYCSQDSWSSSADETDYGDTYPQAAVATPTPLTSFNASHRHDRQRKLLFQQLADIRANCPPRWKALWSRTMVIDAARKSMQDASLAAAGAVINDEFDSPPEDAEECVVQALSAAYKRGATRPRPHAVTRRRRRRLSTCQDAVVRDAYARCVQATGSTTNGTPYAGDALGAAALCTAAMYPATYVALGFTPKLEDRTLGFRQLQEYAGAIYQDRDDAIRRVIARRARCAAGGTTGGTGGGQVVKSLHTVAGRRRVTSPSFTATSDTDEEGRVVGATTEAASGSASRHHPTSAPSASASKSASASAYQHARVVRDGHVDATKQTNWLGALRPVYAASAGAGAAKPGVQGGCNAKPMGAIAGGEGALQLCVRAFHQHRQQVRRRSRELATACAAAVWERRNRHANAAAPPVPSHVVVKQEGGVKSASALAGDDAMVQATTQHEDVERRKQAERVALMQLRRYLLMEVELYVKCYIGTLDASSHVPPSSTSLHVAPLFVQAVHRSAGDTPDVSATSPFVRNPAECAPVHGDQGCDGKAMALTPPPPPMSVPATMMSVDDDQRVTDAAAATLDAACAMAWHNVTRKAGQGKLAAAKWEEEWVHLRNRACDHGKRWIKSHGELIDEDEVHALGETVVNPFASQGASASAWDWLLSPDADHLPPYTGAFLMTPQQVEMYVNARQGAQRAAAQLCVPLPDDDAARHRFARLQACAYGGWNAVILPPPAPSPTAVTSDGGEGGDKSPSKLPSSPPSPLQHELLAALIALAQQRDVWGMHLIVCPDTQLEAWEHAVSTMCTGLRLLPYYGDPHDRAALRAWWNPKQLYSHDATFHVVLTSYTYLLEDFGHFHHLHWRCIVFDHPSSLFVSHTAVQTWCKALTLRCRQRWMVMEALSGKEAAGQYAVDVRLLVHFLLPSLFTTLEKVQAWSICYFDADEAQCLLQLLHCFFISGHDGSDLTTLSQDLVAALQGQHEHEERIVAQLIKPVPPSVAVGTPVRRRGVGSTLRRGRGAAGRRGGCVAGIKRGRRGHVRSVSVEFAGDDTASSGDDGLGRRRRKKRVSMCKRCPGCLAEDCLKCDHCVDMRKYGGPGLRKQVCRRRKCLHPKRAADRVRRGAGRRRGRGAKRGVAGRARKRPRAPSVSGTSCSLSVPPPPNDPTSAPAVRPHAPIVHVCACMCMCVCVCLCVGYTVFASIKYRVGRRGARGVATGGQRRRCGRHGQV